MRSQPPVPKRVATPVPPTLYAVMAVIALLTFAALTSTYEIFFTRPLFA